MTLAKYKSKRTLANTPEPGGGKASGAKLHFVVQKHDATRLHYDFRLEMESVLKSWAVPKGPSLNPNDKRLAMMVEDHPYDYKDFEGIIPKGNYGAGTVIIWDEGYYEPLEDVGSKKDQEKSLLKQLKSGSIKIRMFGKKLKGEFALVKIKNAENNAWLLIKHKDKYAADADVTKKAKSVISGKTIEQMEKNKQANEWESNRKKQTKSSRSQNSKSQKKKAPAKVLDKYTGKGKTKMPADVEPMLATLVEKPVDEPGWFYEVKWDGYRALAYLNDGKVELRSRNNKSFDEKFYPVYDALKTWKTNALVDGEIIVANEKGISNFNHLQQWRSEADGQLIYYVFDILWLEGNDLTSLSLEQRREMLKKIMPDSETIRLSENFQASASEFFKLSEKMGLEGIIAKKAGSQYFPGTRTKEWLKIKTQTRHEVVIGGYTKNEGSNKSFSSLLVGVYEKGKLQYTGKIGTGFNVKQQGEMMKKFKPLVIKKSAFTTIPDINKPSRFRPDPPKASAVWLKPKLVCEVSYREVTEDGVMRHPSFEGLREDKKAKDVLRENPVKLPELKTERKKLADKKVIVPTGKFNRKTFLNPTDKTQVRNVGGHELKFGNLDKIYWPKEKFTKRDLLNYYYQVAPVMLPYLQHRPQSLNRHPNGINGESFYQKDVTGKVPDWIETFPYRSEGDNRDKNFLVCTDEASLLYIASLGCIEINPWSSRTDNPDNPDWCIIDLDPDTNSFDKVIEAAQVTKKVLDAVKLPSYPKTSGSTGIHIYVPLGAKYSYEESKEFARLVVRLVHQQIPNFTSVERATKNRKGKLYLDFLQNRPQATLAAPYSVRPKPGATVSTPLYWEELKKGLKMKDFTIENVPARILKEGDLFKKVLGKGIDLSAAMKKMEGMLEE